MSSLPNESLDGSLDLLGDSGLVGLRRRERKTRSGLEREARTRRRRDETHRIGGSNSVVSSRNSVTGSSSSSDGRVVASRNGVSDSPSVYKNGEAEGDQRREDGTSDGKVRTHWLATARGKDLELQRIQQRTSRGEDQPWSGDLEVGKKRKNEVRKREDASKLRCEMERTRDNLGGIETVTGSRCLVAVRGSGDTSAGEVVGA